MGAILLARKLPVAKDRSGSTPAVHADRRGDFGARAHSRTAPAALPLISAVTRRHGSPAACSRGGLVCPARSCRSSQPADSIDQHTRVLFFDSACAMGDCWHVKHGTVVWNSRPFIK